MKPFNPMAVRPPSRLYRPPGRHFHVCDKMLKPVQTAALLEGRGALAVICSHYNFAGYKSSSRNLIRFIRQQASMGTHVYGIEAYLDNGKPPVTTDIPGWWQEKVSDKGIVWQKEAILNELAARLPKEYSMLAWVDTDVWFENLYWVEHALQAALNGARVMQLFENCMWDDTGDGIPDVVHTSAACLLQQPESQFPRPVQHGGAGHPGLAWAARRDLWSGGRGGLFDLMPGSGGDSLMARACMPEAVTRGILTYQMTTSMHPDTLLKYKAWEAGIQEWVGATLPAFQGI